MKLIVQHLTLAAIPVYGFDNHPFQVQGIITPLVTKGEFPRQATHKIQFFAIDSSLPYNAIFGRPIQSVFKAIPLIPHLAMKFPTSGGTGVVRGNQEVARTCNSKQAQPKKVIALNISDSLF
ncbi:hypothetical protein KSP40_PGU013440 [Platanthera guangdongensis]|uniref:Uncharacterized protein n=1 Tax=Platanthera guangdongensis TaxID=2320717 RepID=A0ABR2LCT9_9ASPA